MKKRIELDPGDENVLDDLTLTALLLASLDPDAELDALDGLQAYATRQKRKVHLEFMLKNV